MKRGEAMKPFLSFGDVGADVTALQQALHDRNFGHFRFAGAAFRRSYPLSSMKPWPSELPLTFTGPSQ